MTRSARRAVARVFLAMSLALSASPALGDEPEARVAQPANEQPRTAVSISVAALSSSAFAAEVERDLGRRKLSAALGIGLRSAAMGDYGSITIGGSAELRRWLRTPMRGWFAALRLEVARTSMEQETEDRSIGALLTTSLALSAGYRFVPYRGLQLTPSIGAAVIRESGLDGRSPASTRGAPVLGLTVGWMF